MLEKALINSTIDSVILKLKENDRITGEEIEQLQKSFDSQNLVIGVVGKMKAGKSTTSIFQMASMPSSGYSRHSTFLMFCSARIAAGPPIDPR